MKHMNAKQNIEDVLRSYSHIGEVHEIVSLGDGNINDTYSLKCSSGRYVLQRINRSVFLEPECVMENIVRITEHLRRKAKENQMDPDRATLSVIRTNKGESYCRDHDGEYWRICLYISNTVTKDRIECVEDMYSCCVSFGAFQHLLADFDAHILHETIDHFHDTPHRLCRLSEAIKKDKCGRVSLVSDEIDKTLSNKMLVEVMERAITSGEIPLRVTHNDTKLSNILFDLSDGSPVAVIDLDTVMPGYSVNDFGDAVRSGASTASEDETNLSLVSMDIELFRAAASGFVEGCAGALTAAEIRLLPYGAMVMTYESAVRFLTDYLEGDIYFKTRYPSHNLDRARNQLALLSDMKKKLGCMNGIIEELL